MPFFDKIKQAAEVMGDKTNDVINITKINQKITSEQGNISDFYKRIGTIIFDQYSSGEEVSDDIKELCENIKLSNIKIREYQDSINVIKSDSPKLVSPFGAPSTNCPACGATNNTDAKFCGSCGSKL